MIAMRVCDNGIGHAAPRVDVEVACGTVQSLRRVDEYSTRSHVNNLARKHLFLNPRFVSGVIDEHHTSASSRQPLCNGATSRATASIEDANSCVRRTHGVRCASLYVRAVGLVSFVMKHLALIVLVMSCVTTSVGAQQSPDVDISKAKAEFISNYDKPRFAVVDIIVKGDVDTLSVVVHPSAIQSIDGKYRYKPKVVRITRIDSSVRILLELSGKGIPLPEDSVRGSARLSVRGAGTFRGSRVRFESRRFEVFVANAPLPALTVITNDLKVDPIFNNSDPVFRMRGVYVRQTKYEPIDSVPDIRRSQVDSIYATVIGAEVGEVGGASRYTVKAVGTPKLVASSNSEYEFTFRLTGGKFPLKKGMVNGAAQLDIWIVYSHGGLSKRRVKRQVISISN